MRRSIDVIFRHPVKKFTVLYQNGQLWQLPKVDFDSQSLQYKKPYRGSRTQIFVAANQQLDPNDTALAAQLFTIDLPNAIVGRNVDEFDNWWRHNQFRYQRIIAAQSQPEPHKTPQLASQDSSNKTEPPSAPLTATVVASSSASLDDLLDDMLADLMKP